MFDQYFWIVFFGIVFIGFWAIDAYFYFSGTHATLSYKMTQWTRKRPLIVFFIGLFIGVIAGHFWNNSACIASGF